MSYLTDEEKAEAIKKWWAENWSAVAGGLALGVVGLFSWNWWTDREATRVEQASQLYTVMLGQVNQGQWEGAASTGSQLLESASRTPYAAMGWALLSDIAVRQGDTEAAIEPLLEAREAAYDEGFREVLTLRLARLHLAAGDLQAARERVGESTAPAFAGLRAEIQGDIARAGGNREEAEAHYRQARDAGHDTDFLRLKLDEVSG